MRNFFSTIFTICLLISGCASTQQLGKSRLDLIQERNKLICGISGKIPGFSFLDTKGQYKGLDVDICKAISAAFIGNANNIEFRPLTAAERFTSLRTGEIDLLSRNTTFNLTRDAVNGNGLIFGPVVFHDGQGLMVKSDSEIKRIEDLDNKSICVGSGTTTEQNINDAFEERSLNYTPIKYQDLNQVTAGYLQNRCSAMTSDRSQLAAARSGFNNPQKHTILENILSKEPLAPASVGNDQKLGDALRWVIYALIESEERGINKKNINEKLAIAKANPEMKSLRRFLGIEGDLGEKIGLKNDFVVKIIRTTGNYGEIYNRNLGPDSFVTIPRGFNKTQKDGGILFSPPFN